MVKGPLVSSQVALLQTLTAHASCNTSCLLAKKSDIIFISTTHIFEILLMVSDKLSPFYGEGKRNMFVCKRFTLGFSVTKLAQTKNIKANKRFRAFPLKTL